MMVSNQCESNYATISGKVSSKPVFSHEVYGEGFYYFFVNVKRLSDSYDRIPVMASERLVSPEECEIGRNIYIEGQFRSYNQVKANHSKLMLMVFAREIDLPSADSDHAAEEMTENDSNQIVLNGYICKPPVYRKTPFDREIADMLLAVNRSYNKSDYIPCISWGRNARYCSKLTVGDNVKITGRIQSRAYQKRHPDGTVEEKVAYEVSVIRLELISAAKAEKEAEQGNGPENPADAGQTAASPQEAANA